MNIIMIYDMNISMNTQRITISLPNYLYEQLTSLLHKGNISRYITEAVEEKIIVTKIKTDPIDEFLSLRKTFPKKNIKQILKAIRRGRT